MSEFSKPPKGKTVKDIIGPNEPGDLPKMKAKRKWAYVQNPKEYFIRCDLCESDNIAWSEYEGEIWCYDCEKDTRGTDGVFMGPINVMAHKLLGICFDRYDLETGEVTALEDYIKGDEDK